MLSLSKRSLKRYLSMSLLVNLIALVFIFNLLLDGSYLLSNSKTSDIADLKPSKQQLATQKGTNQPINSAKTTLNNSSKSSASATLDKTTVAFSTIELEKLVNEAAQAFNQLNFMLAFELHEQIQLDNQVLAQKLQDTWINKTYQWLKQQRFNHVKSVLESVFIFSPYHKDWHIVNVALQKALNKPQEAIKIYRELQLNTFDIDEEEWFLAQIHTLAQQTLKSYREQYAWHEIIDFVLWLLVDEPNYPPYLWALAQAYAHTENAEYALPYLQQLSQYDDYQRQISALYQKINGSEGIDVIKLKKINEHFLVDATLNGHLPATLMIDTGASLTVISSEYYQQLSQNYDIEIKRTITLNTAGGLQEAFTIMIDDFRIGEHSISEMEIVVLDLAHFAASDGLLGMNFLKHFRFAIDQENANLVLEQNLLP